MSAVAYLLVSLVLSSVMLTVIFVIAWVSFGRQRHALFWSLAFFFAAIQWLLNLNSRILPVSFEFYWLLVSLASVLTLSLAVAGFRLRAGLPNRWQWYALGGLVDLAAIAWFLFVAPHVGLRFAIGPLYATAMMGWCIHAVAYPRDMQPAEWGMVAISAIFAACEAAAAIAVLTGGASGTPASQNLYLAINFLSLPAAYVGMGLFTVLILASDMSKAMKVLALSDALTGVLNVRGFADAATRAVSAARRNAAALSVIVCDIDFFKSINDRFGHGFGDHALCLFAQHLRRSARAQDAVGRIGGEEFVMLLPNTPLDVAMEVAERLRLSLSALTVAHERTQIQLHASFGVTALGGPDDDISRIIQRADAALYRSKHDGRNRVTRG